MNGFLNSKKETAVFCLVLLAAVLLFWWRVWIPNPSDRMHFTDDIFIKDYAARIGLFSIALTGHLPLWDPYQFGGWAGIANCEAGFFYPFNWVIVPFLSDPPAAFFVTEMLVLFHFILAGLGTFKLARSIGLSVYGAAFAGFAITFCGFHCAHKKHTNMIFALVWFPWILLAIENWLREHKQKHLMAAVFFLMLAYFAGHPQSVFYMTLILIARWFYHGFGSKEQPCSIPHFFQRVVPGFIVVALAFGLSAVQWFPTAELIEQSARADANQYERSTEFSLPPQELLDAVLPEAVAPWYQTEVFYWGITPLFLAWLCAAVPVRVPLIRFLLFAGISSVLLALGEHFFFYDISYVLIPGSAWVRAPSRWIYMASLPIALSAGYVIDQLNTKNEPTQLQFCSWVLPFWIVWGVLGFAVLMWILLNPAQLDQINTVQYWMQKKSIFLLLFLGLTFAAFHAFAFRRITHSLFACTLLFITWTDLATQYHQLDLAAGTGGHQKLEELKPVFQGSHRTKVFLQSGGIRTAYHGAAQLFRELDGNSPLTPRIHLELREDTAIPFPAKLNEALLRLFGVKNLIIDQPGLPHFFERRAEHVYSFPGDVVHARVLPDVFHVLTSYQRELLEVQSFPYDRAAIMDQSKAVRTDSFSPSMMSQYISKPFLLVSASADAVTSNARLFIDGVDHLRGVRHSSGYVAIVIDPLTAAIEGIDSFDLQSTAPHVDLPKENYDLEQKRLQAYIEAVPNGKTVMLAVKDNAANNLGIQGVKALHQIGGMSDLRQAPLRTAHLVIGKKGAPVGSALEIVSPTEALVMQTESHLYLSGTPLPAPQLELHAATENAPDLLRFYQEDFLQRKDAMHVVPNKNIADQQIGIPVLIFSAPKKRGVFDTDQAVIRVGGKEYSLNQPGYNLVIADPHTYQIKDAANFNFLKGYIPAADDQPARMDWSINENFRRYLADVKDGDLILGAIRDEATDVMQPKTLALLQAMGSKLDAPVDITDPNQLDLRKRYSHAFLMVKGASVCIEAFGQDTDAIIYTRYAGGPRLLSSDLSSADESFSSINTMDEIVHQKNHTPEPLPKPASVELLMEEQGPNEIHIKGNSHGGLLFVSEVYYPGWKVYVDEIESPLHRLNYFFRGVELEAGYHEIKMKYAPESFYTGALVSFFSMLLFASWIIRNQLRRAE